MTAKLPVARLVHYGISSGSGRLSDPAFARFHLDAHPKFPVAPRRPEDHAHRMSHSVPPAPALPAPVVTAARATLTSLRLTPGRYVVCAAAGFANVHLKTWPADRFAAALRHLSAQHALPVLLVGHESERAHLAALLSAVSASPSPTNAPQLWLGSDNSLPTLAALLADARLYLGNDTGAMHLAAALDIPVVAIFGGGTWPRFTPAARRGLALVQPLPCFGCGWDCAFSATEAPCLTGITATDVTSALDRHLAAPDAPFAVHALPLSPSLPPSVFIGAASTRYRALRAEHLARQHKLEELTALDREKDAAIDEKEASIFTKEREIADLKSAANTKDAEISSLKATCDE
eukprot:gene31882-42525_t